MKIELVSIVCCVAILGVARPAFSDEDEKPNGEAQKAHLKIMGQAFLKSSLLSKPDGFGKKSVDETKNGIRLAAGDLFLAKKIHALAFFKVDSKNKAAGVVLFEKKDTTWVLESVWPLLKSSTQAPGKDKKVRRFQLRNLSSDKAPEILLLEGFVKKQPRFQVLRYDRKGGLLKAVASGMGDPYWDPTKKEVLAFDWESNDNNVAVGWRWYKGKLVPLWRCVQRTVKGKKKKVLILAFHKRVEDKWILVRRCRGNIPFYANPAPREVLAPIHTNGEMEGRLSTGKKSYRVTAKLGVMRIASFEMNMREVLDQFSRGLFADPDSFGPKFKLRLPTDEMMYIAQFGRVRVYPEDHVAWKALNSDKDVVSHARNLLTVIGNQDVFALFKLLPPEGKGSLLNGDKNATGPVSVEDAEIFLDAMPELLQSQSGKATPDIKGEITNVVVNAFPANPGGRKASLTCVYAKGKEGWVLSSLKLDWEKAKKK